MVIDPLEPIRIVASKVLRSLFSGSVLPMEQYTEPPGDPGLFGPDSVAWRVHADLAVALGGVAALMLQTLHPLALAAVLEHSDYRKAPLDRLSRTASFVRGTVYGSTPVAESMIETVRTVHLHVVGTAPDGRSYAATDPDLLRWVHVAEVFCFMAAHRRYHPHPVRGRDIDLYYDEMAVVAEKLGATEVPQSRLEVNEYFLRVRPQLARTEQVIRTMHFLTHPRTGNPALDAVLRLVNPAAMGLLPEWSRELLGLRLNRVVELTTMRPAMWSLLNTLRLSLGNVPALEQSLTRCRRSGEEAADQLAS